MVLVLWTAGFLLGSLLFLLAAFLFVFKLIIHPNLVRKLPPFIKPQKLPGSVINDIGQRIENESTTNGITEETAVWLNGIVNWLFMNLSDSAEFQSGLHQVISEIAIDLRRSPFGHLLLDSRLDAIEICGSAPRLQNVKVITGSSLIDPSSSTPLSLQFDLEFEGTCKLKMTFETVFKLNVTVETLVTAFEGSLCLVIQDKTLHFCFLKEPSKLETSTNIFFSNDPKLRYQIPLFNSLFSAWLFKKAIKFSCCFPNFMDQWYRAGPDQPPYPWSPSVVKDPELLYSWTPKMD